MTEPRTPTEIDKIAETWVDTLAELEPTIATYIGRSEYNDRFGDYSPAGTERLVEEGRKTLAELEAATVDDDVDAVTKEDLSREIQLELNLHDANARAIMVQDALNKLLHGLFGLGARGGEDRLDVALTDDLAHGAFGDRLHGSFRILDVEEEVRRVADLPEHDEINVDDILVAGEHQALFGHIADGGRRIASV